MTSPEILFRLALSLAIPLAAAWVLTPAAGRLARRLNIIDRPAPHKFHRRATPYLGGMAVAAGLLLEAFRSVGLTTEVATILAGAVGLALLGLLDDMRGMLPAPKLAAETLAALALWIVGIRAEVFGVPGLDLALTVLWVLAVINAFNLLDNMDGLAGGAAAISALTLALIAITWEHNRVATLALALAGASLGFLRHNFPPARIFLGDTGTLFIGFLLAALALKVGLLGGRGPVPLIIPALAIGVPVFDTLLVIVSRTLERRPVYKGGKDHCSHRLVLMGLTSKQVAVVVYSAQGVCALAAVALVHATSLAAALLVLILAVAAGVSLVYMLRVPGRFVLPGLRRMPELTEAGRP